MSCNAHLQVILQFFFLFRDIDPYYLSANLNPNINFIILHVVNYTYIRIKENIKSSTTILIRTVIMYIYLQSS